MLDNITYLRRRMESSQGIGLLVAAAILGLVVAVGVYLYRLGIEFFHELFAVEATHVLTPVLGALAGVATLTAAGFIVGLWMEKFVGPEKYHGVAGVIEAVAFSGGKLPYKKLPFKAIASALSLGAGASNGPEDPSVQIGANAGSFIGRILNMREDSLRLLVAAGAAAGVSAAFKAPIAGVFFALEVILNHAFATGSISAVVISAVVASAAITALEPGVEMGPFNYQLGGPLELSLFIPLGLILAFSTVLYVRGVYWQHDVWHHYLNWPRRYKTAFAGALVGIIGIFLPQILGIGREPMNAVLEGVANYSFAFLILLFIAKIIASIISMAGGFVGGIFAPSLFAGTMIGAAYGQFVDRVFGLHVGDPQSYAIAGMAGMLAGVLRAPITAIMMVFELTNDYNMILPIMLITVVTVAIADRYEKHGIYSLGLIRHGIRLQPGREIDVMQGVTVKEVMTTPAPSISENASLLTLRDTLRSEHTSALCVLDGAQLVGIVTLSDLQNAYARPNSETLTVKDICNRDLVVIHPEDDLWTAVRTMSQHEVGRLPVVQRGTMDVVGLIGRHGIVRAYNIAINRKLQDQHIAERVRLNNLTGGNVFELGVHENAPAAGQAIRDVKWPPDSVVASITRHGRLLVPHGSTVLQVGDMLSIVANPLAHGDLLALTGADEEITINAAHKN